MSPAPDALQGGNRGSAHMEKRVTVHLHASLGRRRSGTGNRGPVLTRAATVGELLDELHISQAEVIMVFVNGKRAATESLIRDGDEIRLFPLVGGG
jgi:sulfur carrier protein ThiS